MSRRFFELIGIVLLIIGIPLMVVGLVSQISGIGNGEVTSLVGALACVVSGKMLLAVYFIR